MATGVYIDGVERPECCGECFAFDDSGCKFIKVDKNSPEIWKHRAPGCPMHFCHPTCSSLNKAK